MRVINFLFLNLLLVIFFGACLEAPTQNTDKICPTGDVNCFSENFYLVDQNDDKIPLTTVATSKLVATEGDGVPSIIGSARPIAVKSLALVYKIDFDWKDPQNSTPAFCITHCSAGAGCSTSSRCTSSLADGLTSGKFQSWIAYTATAAGNAGSFDEYDLTIRPLSTSNGDDPVGILNGASDKSPPPNPPFIGKKYTINEKIYAKGSAGIKSPTGSPGGSGKSSGSCTTQQECAKSCYSNRSCVVNRVASGCDCSGLVETGTCSATKSCIAFGEDKKCGSGEACCFGQQCVNGACEKIGTGRCSGS